jgi:hypothetical protein
MTLQTKILCGTCRTYFLAAGGSVCLDCTKLQAVRASIDRVAASERQYRMLTGGEK